MPVSMLNPRPAAPDTIRIPLRHDAAAASEFALRLALGDVMLAFQPIIATGGLPLYYEVLTRIRDGADGEPCGELLAALERLDRIASYDMLVLNTVIDLLEAYPQVALGCNVSARTLCLAVAGWKAVFARLRGQAALAARLTLELTERALPADAQDALFILATLQQFGCKIAIDDLGGNRMALAFVQDCQPDYIKLDGSLLYAGTHPARRRALLDSLVALCRTICPMVVIEGVDSAAKLRLARQVDASALQGFHLSAPCLRPDWLAAPVCLLPVPDVGASWRCDDIHPGDN